MSQRYFSLWQVVGLVGIVAVIATVALAGGLLVGYQWGRAATLAQAPERAADEQTEAPLLAWPDFDFEPFAAPEQPYLGLTYEALTPALAKQEGLDIETGALVRTVTADSPAEAAGIRPGDVIVAVNGQPVNSGNPLRERVLALEPGDQAALTVQRGTEQIELTVTLGVRPDAFMPQPFEQLIPGQGWTLECNPPEPCRLVPQPGSPQLEPSEQGKALVGPDKSNARRAPMEKDHRSVVPERPAAA
jgi:membrane-associated protease RseP (regulator of RpoE activity)